MQDSSRQPAVRMGTEAIPPSATKGQTASRKYMELRVKRSKRYWLVLPRTRCCQMATVLLVDASVRPAGGGPHH